MSVYFEGEREHGVGQRERERERERENPKQAPHCQSGARYGARTHEPRDPDLSPNQEWTLNPLRHPGALYYLIF